MVHYCLIKDFFYIFVNPKRYKNLKHLRHLLTVDFVCPTKVFMNKIVMRIYLLIFVLVYNAAPGNPLISDRKILTLFWIFPRRQGLISSNMRTYGSVLLYRGLRSGLTIVRFIHYLFSTGFITMRIKAGCDRNH